MFKSVNVVRLFILVLSTLALVACGGGGGGGGDDDDTGNGPGPGGGTGGTGPGIFEVSVSVKGVTGNLVIDLGNGNTISINADGNYTFPQKLATGAAYKVLVTTNPVGLTCQVSDSSGIANDNVSNIVINCGKNFYLVSGSATGLTGDVVISLNGESQKTVTPQKTNFTFDLKLVSGVKYDVTVLSVPEGQACKVLGSGKNIVNDDINDISIECGEINYSVGGTVNGLLGQLSLTLNSGEILNINSNGGFTMPNTVFKANNFVYRVAVSKQPDGQTCELLGFEGIAKANITNVVINCTNIDYTIGGTVTGLLGDLSLSLKSGAPLLIKRDGDFTFPGQLLNIGNDYTVVATPPAGQNCAVDLGAAGGTVKAVDVTDITITCSNIGYNVGGTVGPFAGSLSLKLSSPDTVETQTLSVTSGQPFTFTTLLLNKGNEYTVTVANQPATQNCALTNASGTIGIANVTTVLVKCSDTFYTIGGTINGLNGSVVLLNNLSDDLTVTNNNAANPKTFTFATPIGATNIYSVTVKTQPAGQFCDVVSGASGPANAAVTNVILTCIKTYDLAVNVTGLNVNLFASLGLLNNNVALQAITTNGSTTVATMLRPQAAYAVTMMSQPEGQTCSFDPATPGSGSIGAANVSININCRNIDYTVGGAIAGLTGTIRLILNAGTPTSFSIGNFIFTNQPLNNTNTYAVTIGTQPANETCSFTSGDTGTIGTSNVSNVIITCINNLLDTDKDGVPDVVEIANGTNPNLADTDGDGFNDLVDALPLDPTESLDNDGDGIGDNADPDDDNDTYNDVNDFFPFDKTKWAKTILDLSTLNGMNGFIINGINDDDNSGISVSSADVNGDQIADIIIGASGANGNNSVSGYDGTDNVGETYVIFGNGTANFWQGNFNLSSLNGTNGFVIKGERGLDESGMAVSGLGDINGDNINDFIIGAYFADTGSNYTDNNIATSNDRKNAGQSYVVFGKANWTGVVTNDEKGIATLELKNLGANGFVINGILPGDVSGRSVKDAGDINNDGINDIVIGASGANSLTGQSYVIFGRPATKPWGTRFELSSLGTDATAANGFVINGRANVDVLEAFSGWSVSGAGDVNGDQIDDLLISAHKATANGLNNAGEIYVIFGRAQNVNWASTFELSTLATGGGTNGFVIQGAAAGDTTGHSVSGAGDINSDGAADIIIGANLADTAVGSTAGKAYVVFGKTSNDAPWGQTFGLSTLANGNGVNGFVVEGIASNDQIGSAVSSAGDVNGDQIDDIIIGATRADVASFTDAGETYIIFGRALGTNWTSKIDVATLNGLNGFRTQGIDMNDLSGIAISYGDINNDNYMDMIIGASKADPNGSSSGESYVVFGCDYSLKPCVK